MKFEKTWQELGEALIEKIGLPEDTPLPTPADVANALEKEWMAAAREEYRKRFSDMYDLVEVGNPDDRPDLFPPDDDSDPPAGWHYLGRGSGLRFNGLPMHDWLLTADGEIDERLSAGLQILHLNMLANGKGRPIPTKGTQEHYHPDLNHPQQGNVHFEISTDREDTISAWATWLAMLSDGFEAVHQVWESVDPDTRDMADLKHPLAALIESWLRRPEEIRPDVDKHGRPRKSGIMPTGLFDRQPITIPALLRSQSEMDELSLIGRIGTQDQLPLLAELMADSDIPVTPLLLADAAGFRGLQPGRGARYDKRLLIFSLLAMPRNQRRPGGRYELRRSLRDWRDTIWPSRNGKSSYRPVKHALPLHSALQAVNLAEVVMSDGYHWRPVIVRGYPAFDDLDSEVIIQIELPGGSDHGPMIDKPALIEAGTISDPAFDLELGLAYLWDDAKRRNGGRRIYATRPEALRNGEGYTVDADGEVNTDRLGRPSTRWDHPHAVLTGGTERHPAADRVQVLDREDRRQLAYGRRKQGQAPANYTRDCNRTDALLTSLENEGRIVIERNAIDSRTGKRGWRILETWPGE